VEDRLGKGGRAAGEHEEITVVERPLKQLVLDLDQGRIADGKLVALILALRWRKPELFTAGE
jgi:hypothetical protein